MTKFSPPDSLPQVLNKPRRAAPTDLHARVAGALARRMRYARLGRCGGFFRRFSIDIDILANSVRYGEIHE
jgi:hypothetical protein